MNFNELMAGYTIDRLADEAGVGTSTLERYKAGEVSKPSLNSLQKISRCLRVEEELVLDAVKKSYVQAQARLKSDRVSELLGAAYQALCAEADEINEDLDNIAPSILRSAFESDDLVALAHYLNNLKRYAGSHSQHYLTFQRFVHQLLLEFAPAHCFEQGTSQEFKLALRDNNDGHAVLVAARLCMDKHIQDENQIKAYSLQLEPSKSPFTALALKHKFIPISDASPVVVINPQRRVFEWVKATYIAFSMMSCSGEHEQVLESFEHQIGPLDSFPQDHDNFIQLLKSKLRPLNTRILLSNVSDEHNFVLLDYKEDPDVLRMLGAVLPQLRFVQIPENAGEPSDFHQTLCMGLADALKTAAKNAQTSDESMAIPEQQQDTVKDLIRLFLHYRDQNKVVESLIESIQTRNELTDAQQRRQHEQIMEALNFIAAQGEEQLEEILASSSSDSGLMKRLSDINTIEGLARALAELLIKLQGV